MFFCIQYCFWFVIVCYVDSCYIVMLVWVSYFFDIMEGEVIFMNIDVIVGFYVYIMFNVIVLVKGNVNNCYCQFKVSCYYFLIIEGGFCVV